MSRVRQIASYLIEISSPASETDLTHLKLQKVLYYGQVESIKQRGHTLFDDTIEAWQYGPVVRDVYEWLKPCGGYPITDFDVATDASELSDEDRAFLDSIWERYGIYSPFYLVNKTHAKGEPWDQVFEDYAHNPIPTDLLKSASTVDAW